MQHRSFHEQELEPYLHQAFGVDCRIVRAENMKGGARKQVYVLELVPVDHPCLLYIWHDVHHYFAERDELDVTQSDVQAPLLFEANARLFRTLGIDVPQIYASGVLAAGHHFALVEHLGTRNFTSFAQDASPEVSDRVVQQVGSMLRRLNDLQRSCPGTLLDAASPWDIPCHEHTLRRALLELDSAAQTHVRVAEHAVMTRQRLQTLAARLEPRRTYRMIHGELGPEHLMIRPGTDSPCFIDLDGAHFFDVEAEHALLAMRFGNDLHSRFLARAGLDPARMTFYRLALHVSLVYAGARFLAAGYPDREWAQDLFDDHLKSVVASL